MTAQHFYFDLDGTITKKEILPEIGRETNKYKEIESLTKLTINGKIPFEDSLKRRVSILKDVDVSKVNEICSKIPLNDEIVRFINEHKDSCSIVTGNLDVWIEPIVKKLGITTYSSTASVKNNKIVDITNIIRKKDVIINSESAFKVVIGDGYNDTEMIEAADIGIAFGGVHWPAINLFEYCTHATFDERSLCNLLKQLL